MRLSGKLGQKLLMLNRACNSYLSLLTDARDHPKTHLPDFHLSLFVSGIRRWRWWWDIWSLKFSPNGLKNCSMFMREKCKLSKVQFLFESKWFITVVARVEADKFLRVTSDAALVQGPWENSSHAIPPSTFPLSCSRCPLLYESRGSWQVA